MTSETNSRLTEEQIQLALKLEAIFMPQAKRQRDEAYQRLKKPEDSVAERQLRFVHYTSAEAAISIIRNKRLWMRNTNCMSDYREVRHGFEILNRFFSNSQKQATFVTALDDCAPGAALEALNLFGQWWRDIQLNSYVSSVSEHDDKEDEHGRLSMWRAFGGTGVRVAVVFKVPRVSQGSLALNLMFSPVAYLSEGEVCAVIQEVIQNVADNRDFLRKVTREQIVVMVFQMLVAGVTCLKHEGFREEREWRAIYTPGLRASALMESSTEVVGGVPQVVYKVPLDARVSPILADLDFSRIFDRLIIGPSSYPWVMYEAFARELKDAGVPDAANRVWNSNIPIRT